LTTAISCLGAFRSPTASARPYSRHGGNRKPAHSTQRDIGLPAAGRRGRKGTLFKSISETQRGEAFEIFTLLPREGRFIARGIRSPVIGAFSVSRRGKLRCCVSQCIASTPGCSQKPPHEQSVQVPLQTKKTVDRQSSAVTITS
jgi:hypothetical protein